MYVGLGPGDILWTSAISFVASSNCGRYCGAEIDFIDIDPKTYNMCSISLQKKLEEAKKIGKLPKVVVPVHFCGQSCDMEAIHSLSLQYGFKIIEDASHAIGGKYKENYIGNSNLSDITIFSFHPVKMITTGEGGLALTNNKTLAEKMTLLRSHGITSNSEDMELRPKVEIWNYQQSDLGFNYRMTDIQAALGISQFSRLEEFLKRRHQIAKLYDQALSDLPLKLPWQDPDSYSSYHLYPILLKTDETELSQKQVYNSLRELGIAVNLHYIPIYLQPYYRKLGFEPGYCREAEDYYKRTISIPIYPSLTEENQIKVVSALQRILRS